MNWRRCSIRPRSRIALEQLRTERQEVEAVGVLYQRLRELGLPGGEGAREVGQRLSLSGEQIAVDLVREHAAAPPVLERLFGVPAALRWLLDGLNEPDVVPQGNWATSCCTIAGSGHASANARMYLRFRAERPFMPGKAAPRSLASRSMTFAPQPAVDCRSRISCPIRQ